MTHAMLWAPSERTFNNFKFKVGWYVNDNSIAENTPIESFTGTTVSFSVKDTNNNEYALADGDYADFATGKIFSGGQLYDLHPDEIAKIKLLKSVYPSTNIFTSANIQPNLSLSIRKLGNRPFVEHLLTDEGGNFLVDENGNNIIGVT